MAIYNNSSLLEGSTSILVGTNLSPTTQGIIILASSVTMVSTTAGSGSAPATPQYYWSS